jgi:hypothetical protein
MGVRIKEVAVRVWVGQSGKWWRKEQVAQVVVPLKFS